MIDLASVWTHTMCNIRAVPLPVVGDVRKGRVFLCHE